MNIENCCISNESFQIKSPLYPCTCTRGASGYNMYTVTYNVPTCTQAHAANNDQLEIHAGHVNYVYIASYISSLCFGDFSNGLLQLVDALLQCDLHVHTAYTHSLTHS